MVKKNKSRHAVIRKGGVRLLEKIIKVSLRTIAKEKVNKTYRDVPDLMKISKSGESIIEIRGLKQLKPSLSSEVPLETNFYICKELKILR